MKRRVLSTLFLALGLIVCQANRASAVPSGTAFSYQGRLTEAESSADGLYDFQFKLYDNVTDGNQLGNTIGKNEVNVIDGYFTVELDFGSDAFDGDDRWLEIGVRPGDFNGTGAYTILSPRQRVTPTPYAIYAKAAGTALDSYKGVVAPIVSYVRPDDIKLILPLDDITEWTAYRGTATADPNNCFCSRQMNTYTDGVSNNAQYSIKVTASGYSGGIEYDFGENAGQDFSRAVFVGRFYIHPGTGNSDPDPDDYSNPKRGLNKVKIYLFDATQGISNNYLYQYFMLAKVFKSASDTIDGWYEIAIPVSNLLEAGSGADISNIRYIRLGFEQYSYLDSISITWDRLLIYEPSHRAMYALRFDNTTIRVLEAARYLASKGLRGSFGIKPHEVGTEGRLTVTNLQELQQLGHDVCLYTGSYPWSAWRDKTRAEKIEVLEQASKFFRENGLREDSAGIVFTSGAAGWNRYDEGQLKGQYFYVAGAGSGPYGGTPRDVWTLFDPKVLYWSVFNTDPSADGNIPADLPDRIERAEENRGILVLGSHLKSDNELHSLKEAIAALAESDLYPTTFRDISSGQNMPKKDQITVFERDIMADTTLAEIVPATYKIKRIRVVVKQGGAAGKKISIGSTAGGRQVVDAFELHSDRTFEPAVIDSGRFYSLTEDQTLYVHSDQATTPWSQGTPLIFDLKITLEEIL